MRAAVIPEPGGTLTIVDRALPEPGEGEIRVRTLVSVQEVFTLDEAADAMARFAQGTLGKVVINVG